MGTEHRLRIFKLSEEAVLQIIREVYKDQLPEGCSVLQVDADWTSRTLRIMVEHESFEVHKEGAVVKTEEVLIGGKQDSSH